MPNYVVQLPRSVTAARLASPPTSPPAVRHTVPASAGSRPGATHLGGSEKMGTTDRKASATAPHAQADVLAVLARIEQQIRARAGTCQDTLRELQELAVTLATEIAGTIVGYEVTHHSTRIKQLLADAAAQSPTGGPLVAYVHPDDKARLDPWLSESRWSGGMIQLRVDPALAKGDCRVEVGELQMRAAWRQQLQQIQHQLLEYLQNARLTDEPA